jgi:hypothetical protein
MDVARNMWAFRVARFGVWLASMPLLAPLPAALFGAQPALARIETVRFVDGNGNPSPVVGFRLHLATVPGAYGTVIEMGLPPADAAGVRRFPVEVGEVGTVYLAASAYDAEGRSSALSNEISRAPRTARFDHDGDGASDLLHRDAVSGRLELAAVVGASAVRRPLEAVVPDGWFVAARGDYDASGTSDLLLRRLGGGELEIWMLVASAPPNVVVPPAVGERFEAAGSGDLDGDGRDDLVLRDPATGELEVWLLGELGVSESVRLVGPRGPWVLAGVGDVDADRCADLVWRRRGRGDLEIWKMAGTFVVEQLVVPDLLAPGWELAGLADHDHDGADDLVLRRRATGQIGFRSLLEAVGPYEPLAVSAPGRLELVTGRDFDGDAWSDLALLDPFTRTLAVQLLGPGAFAEDIPLDLSGSQLPSDLAREVGDRDGDWNPDRCDADFNNDGMVGAPDLFAVAACFGAEAVVACEGPDLDGDGVVGAPDLALFAQRFGEVPCAAERRPR